MEYSDTMPLVKIDDQSHPVTGEVSSPDTWKQGASNLDELDMQWVLLPTFNNFSVYCWLPIYSSIAQVQVRYDYTNLDSFFCIPIQYT